MCSGASHARLDKPLERLPPLGRAGGRQVRVCDAGVVDEAVARGDPQVGPQARRQRRDRRGVGEIDLEELGGRGSLRPDRAILGREAVEADDAVPARRRVEV